MYVCMYVHMHVWHITHKQVESSLDGMYTDESQLLSMSLMVVSNEWVTPFFLGVDVTRCPDGTLSSTFKLLWIALSLTVKSVWVAILHMCVVDGVTWDPSCKKKTYACTSKELPVYQPLSNNLLLGWTTWTIILLQTGFTWIPHVFVSTYI